MITRILFVALLFPASVFAQQTVTGYVYIDKNQDGQRNASETVLGRIGVSNSRQIALTDSQVMYFRSKDMYRQMAYGVGCKNSCAITT